MCSLSVWLNIDLPNMIESNLWYEVSLGLLGRIRVSVDDPAANRAHGVRIRDCHLRGLRRDILSLLKPIHGPRHRESDLLSRWKILNLTAHNTIANLLGLYPVLRNSIERMWNIRATALMKSLVLPEVQQKLNARHGTDDMRILHLDPPFLIPLLLTSMKNGRLVMRYNGGEDTLGTKNIEEEEDYAHRHTYSYPTLMVIYLTFRQTLPDLLLHSGRTDSLWRSSRPCKASTRR